MREKGILYLGALTTLLLVVNGIRAEEAPIPRVGVLIPESLRAESQAVKGIREGLKEMGYREGKNIYVEVRDAKGDRAALKQQVAELVQKKVALIFTTGTRATQAATSAGNGISVIFIHPADPVALGFVKSMERPGGNVTGVAALALQKTERRLEILKEIFPKVQRITVFFDSNNPYSRENFLLAQKSATKLGLDVTSYPIKSAEELKKSLSGLQRKDGDALFHVPDDLVEAEADYIFQQARQKGLPTMFNEENWAIKGGLASYGPSYYHMGRQAAGLADKILKGAKARDLPVERGNKFDLVINFRTARTIGLSIPSEVLKRADRVIR